MRRAPVKRGCTTTRSPVERSRTTSLARRQLRSMRAPLTRRASSRAETSRNTSALVTTTSVIVAPLTSRCRSRAMVSVSGSSGMPHCRLSRDLAPADVAAEVLAGELHQRRELATLALRLVDCWRAAGHRENATAVGDEIAVRRALRAGVKDDDIIRYAGHRDDVAGARRVGIPTARKDGR